jgi:hypothetical protein
VQKSHQATRRNDSIFSTPDVIRRLNIMTPTLKSNLLDESISVCDYSKLAPSEIGKIGHKLMPLTPPSNKKFSFRNTKIKLPPKKLQNRKETEL